MTGCATVRIGDRTWPVTDAETFQARAAARAINDPYGLRNGRAKPGQEMTARLYRRRIRAAGADRWFWVLVVRTRTGMPHAWDMRRCALCGAKQPTEETRT